MTVMKIFVLVVGLALEISRVFDDGPNGAFLLKIFLFLWRAFGGVNVEIQGPLKLECLIVARRVGCPIVLLVPRSMIADEIHVVGYLFTIRRNQIKYRKTKMSLLVKGTRVRWRFQSSVNLVRITAESLRIHSRTGKKGKDLFSHLGI